MNAKRIWIFSLLIAAISSQAMGQANSLSPSELIRLTVHNELETNRAPGANFMFCDHKQAQHGSENKAMVETHTATAGLVVARNGQALNESEHTAEIAREQRFVTSPDELRTKQHHEQEDRNHTIQIMKALPDAFVYEEGGTEAGTKSVGKLGHELIHLNFRPNPKYVPPSHVEQVLTGLQGYILVDAQEHRIARIDGTLFRDVDFGWGILGKLYQGGRFLVEQGDVGDGQWEITHMRLSLRGRALLVKKLAIESDEVFTGFRRVPDTLSFADGLHMLESDSPCSLTTSAEPAKHAN